MQDTAVKEASPEPGSRIAGISMDSPGRFINRELSWLAFNSRVLEEALNRNHPLLERLRFLSISGSNLDEFYMVRVAGLHGQVKAGVEAVSPDGMTPLQQLVAVNRQAEILIRKQVETWTQLIRELRAEGIAVLDTEEITAQDHEWLEGYFLESLFPLLTPLAIDPAHPFPFIPNLGFSMVLRLERQGDGAVLNMLIPLPRQTRRFVRLPGDEIRYISIENIITLF
ncbi:MAG: RNA degradosome polyphosphate kinase, partial [Alphaproteobacteria bacterium]